MPKKTGKKPAAVAVIDAEIEATYTLDVVARLTGVTSQTIVHYREQGLIAPVKRTKPNQFDAEALRQLRRIEHLRATHELNLPAVKLVLGLMSELERLQHELRARSLR